MAIFRIIAILIIATTSVNAQTFRWPGGADAAISLTYDDGVPSHVSTAIPQLNVKGFKGTFYVTPANTVGHIASWRRAFNYGHEIANHTASHACGNQRWLMSPSALRNDISEGNAWLNTAIGFDPDRTFAYPCGETDIAPDGQYEMAVMGQHFAARMGLSGLNDPLTVDPLRISGKWFHDLNTSTPLIDLCEDAAAINGWAVFLFHDIGTDVTASAHEGLLAYLRDYSLRPQKYWVAPVKTVMRYILDHRPPE